MDRDSYRYGSGDPREKQASSLQALRADSRNRGNSRQGKLKVEKPSQEADERKRDKQRP